jgi:hypothetical protein
MFRSPGTTGATLPPLPLEEWEATKETLHRYCQIAGKLRMELTPPLNHWWHVTLHVDSRGLISGPIPYYGSSFELCFDLVDNRLVVATSEGEGFSFALDDLPVAEFYRRLFEGLESLDIEASINPRPFDLDDEHTLEENVVHCVCDREYVRRYWRVLVWADSVFKEFAGRFNGKTSPVQLFWHSFDLAVTRFSGRRAPLAEGVDPVTREAYSHEVISFGFWPGDRNVRYPAFYSYTAPEPEGLIRQPLRPEAAAWGEGSATLPYEAVRRADVPREALLEFMQSAYEAGARTAGWDVEEFRAR